MQVKFRETLVRWYKDTRLETRGVHLTRIYFDNREMEEGEKLDIRKLSKYPDNLTLVSGHVEIW